jgi:hypothetical protein
MALIEPIDSKCLPAGITAYRWSGEDRLDGKKFGFGASVAKVLR